MLNAKVAWGTGRRFGVSFARPLLPAQIAQVLAEQQALICAASRRIGAVS